jgi:hypothetical protein
MAPLQTAGGINLSRRGDASMLHSPAEDHAVTGARAMSRKYAKAVLYGLVAIVIVTTGAAYALAHLSYVPLPPIEISKNFIDLIQAGNLDDAYLLTNQEVSVGSSFAAFEANIRYQMAIDAFPTNRPVKLIGTHSFQTYGNWLRRSIMGRKIDPDQVSVDYFIGLPFEVRLRSNDKGEWRITYFQSHAG